jgi:hypothetical protein
MGQPALGKQLKPTKDPTFRLSCVSFNIVRAIKEDPLIVFWVNKMNWKKIEKLK